MKRRLIAAGVVGGLALLAPMQAGAAEVTKENGVPTLVRDAPGASPYGPLRWESPAPTLPTLGEETAVAVHDDDDALKFLGSQELGSFLEAPLGGSVFFGAGQPMFGLASPPLTADRVLRPLGGVAPGARFLGSRPTANPATVIPKVGQTFDGRRESFAFVDGVPPLGDVVEAGTTAFPLASAVHEGGEWGELDNIVEVPLPDADPEDPLSSPAPGVRPPGTVTGTVTGTPTTDAAEAPVPTTAPAPGTTIPRLASPATVPTPTSTPTSTPPTVPPTTTTAPPATAPTTTPSTGTPTISAPPTTVPRTTTSTTSTTTTTPPSSGPPTTTTTAPPPPAVGTTFVMGNGRADDVTDANTTCLSNGGGSSATSCDRLFDIDQARPGTPYRVNLTLWNVDPDSESDAVALKVFAAGGCTNGTVPGGTPGSNADLCGAVQLTIQRFTNASRTVSADCIYGGANCSFDPSKTLSGFAATHGSWSSGASVDGNFRVNDKAYLVLTVRLPDRGFDAEGRGRDNEYMARTAAMALTWRMESS